MTASFHIEPLSRRHDTSRFDCEKESLNEFIKRFARQNEEKRISRTFVAVAPDRPEILGYYTLSTGAIEFADLPEESRRRLPRYPIPVAHLGRLAVDRSAKGVGLGEFLMIDAFRRTMLVAGELGIFAVEVIALDADARRFYQKYGFAELADDDLHLYLPIKMIERLGLV